MPIVGFSSFKSEHMNRRVYRYILECGWCKERILIALCSKKRQFCKKSCGTSYCNTKRDFSGKNNSFYGKRHSKKTKQKLSKTRTERIANGTIVISNSRGLKGFYYSTKMKENFHYDSFWELARMKILDLDDNVISYSKNHEIRIPYKINNQIRNYVPDFYIEYKNGNKVIEEIKGKDDGYKNETKLKLKALNKYCENNDISWALLKYKEITNLCSAVFNRTVDTLRIHYKLGKF